MKILLAALAFVVVVVVVMPACNLFGTVRCQDSAACPATLPVCASGTCVASDGGEGEGEGEGGAGGEGEGEGGAGEGEGEGQTCSTDVTCGNGLCCTDGGFCRTLASTCVGLPAGSCATTRGSRDREAAGPAIFDVTVQAGAACQPSGASVQVGFSYVDREGDMETSSDSGPIVYAQTSTSFEPFVFQTAQILGSTGTAAAGTVTVVGCVDVVDAQGIALYSQDTAGHLSNIVCATAP